MARTALTLQTAVRGTGLNPTFEAATTDGQAVDNTSQRVYLHVKNTGGTVCNVTIPTPITIDGKTVTDLTFTVPATTGERIVGPFPHAVYCQVDAVLSLTHAVYINYDQVTGVTVAAIKVPAASY